MTKTFKIILVAVAFSLLIVGSFAFYYFLNYPSTAVDENFVLPIEDSGDVSLFVKEKKFSRQDDNFDVEIIYPFFENHDNLNNSIEVLLDNYLAIFFESAHSYQSALDDLSDVDETFDFEYYLHGNYEKGRFDNDYISFVLIFDYYSGGAHGGRDFYSFAYDLKKQEEIFLSDLFTGQSNYLNDVSQFCFNDVRKQIKEKTGDDWVDEEWLKSGLSPDLENFKNFIFDKESVTFYFPHYQLAAYVLGDFKVRFPWVSHLERGENWTGVANPASLNCESKGGELFFRTNALGQYGVCLFEDDKQCEEWSLFYGYCPEGGVKITGYKYEAEIYCAILGGETTTGASSCTFNNGKVCLLDDLYQGRCDRNLLSADDELRLYLYVEDNLDRFLPKTAVYGENLHITRLEILSFDEGKIEYEDGPVSFVAIFNFIIDNKNIFVDNFRIIE